MLKRFYTAIVHRRRAVLAAFVLAAVLSVFASRAVQVDYDINDYLPPDSPSTIALEQMNSAFTGGNSTFEIPVAALGTPLAVTADTVAMSTPHEIEYTLTFTLE